MTGYITQKTHKARIAAKDAIIDELDDKINELERDVEYWRRSNDAEYKARLKLQNQEQRDIGSRLGNIKNSEKLVRRAHEEISRVKPTEKDPSLLMRAIGDVQGILACILDTNRDEGQCFAERFDPYPDEEREHNNQNSYENILLNRKSNNYGY